MQRRLWESLVVNPLPAVKVALHEAAKASRLSREQLTDDMNRLAHLAGMKLKVGHAMLEKWLNPGAEDYPPNVAALYLFCQATGDNSPLEVYVRAFPGTHLVDEADYQLLLWAKAEKTARQAKRQARQLAPKAGVE
jgi:hypothetical protein